MDPSLVETAEITIPSCSIIVSYKETDEEVFHGAPLSSEVFLVCRVTGSIKTEVKNSLKFIEECSDRTFEPHIHRFRERKTIDYDSLLGTTNVELLSFPCFISTNKSFIFTMAVSNNDPVVKKITSSKENRLVVSPRVNRDGSMSLVPIRIDQYDPLKIINYYTDGYVLPHEPA